MVRTKLVSSVVCMLLLCAGVPVLAIGTAVTSFSTTNGESSQASALGQDGWYLQWSHDYGGMGHSQFAQPVGDLDDDGVNEVAIGGYEDQGHFRLISYVDGTYVEEYSYAPQGGFYNIPTGASIVDLNGDGTLELIVAYGYTSADGVYVYQWDGTTMTTLDYYYGNSLGFIYDVYAMDYDEDGQPEILVSNAPWGTLDYYVIALEWVDDHLEFKTGWECPSGNEGECCMVSSGDLNNDGHNEIVADISYMSSLTHGTWMLSWNPETETFDGSPIWTDYGSNTVYGDCVGDIDGDGTPEIGVGSYGGECTVWLFEWDGSSFQMVWEQVYPGGESIIESVDIGDADNDGQKEFCYGGGNCHVLGWNGTGYALEHLFTEVTGMEAGINVGDFDTDGLNELKACEIISATGYELIWKTGDETPPETTCILDGTMVGSVYVSNVTVTLTATDAGVGVAMTNIKIDDGDWSEYTEPIIVMTEGVHSISYYSVDKIGNTETVKTTSFTIWKKPVFEVTFYGGLGVRMKVTNVGPANLSMVQWSLKLEGKHVLIGNVGGVIPSLEMGKSVTLRMPVLGVGKVTVQATIGQYAFNTTGMVILFAILCKK